MCEGQEGRNTGLRMGEGKGEENYIFSSISLISEET